MIRNLYQTKEEAEEEHRQLKILRSKFKEKECGMGTHDVAKFLSDALNEMVRFNKYVDDGCGFNLDKGGYVKILKMEGSDKKRILIVPVDTGMVEQIKLIKDIDRVVMFTPSLKGKIGAIDIMSGDPFDEKYKELRTDGYNLYIPDYTSFTVVGKKIKHMGGRKTRSRRRKVSKRNSRRKSRKTRSVRRKSVRKTRKSRRKKRSTRRKRSVRRRSRKR